MRMIFGLVLIVGIALAGAAVYMAKGYINKTEFALQEELKIKARTGGLVELFVVNKPKNYGEQLTKDDVQMIYWPKNALPEAAFFDPAVLFPEDNTAPRYVLRQMEQFEPVLAMKVTEPGDHVDIYWTGAVSGNDGELTRLIETKVKIIAVDRSPKKGLSDGAIAARTMTVAATPEQVARLAQAQATGRLVMSLVGMGDDSAAGFVEVDSDALLGIEQQTAAKIEEEKVCTIRTRKGADVLEIPIPCTN